MRAIAVAVACLGFVNGSLAQVAAAPTSTVGSQEPRPVVDPVSISAPAVAEEPKQCELPRVELFGRKYIDACRLGEPEVFACLLRTADLGDEPAAVEWAQILLWEGKVHDGYGACRDVGGLFPRMESRLRGYIELGVKGGSHYSMLAKAAYVQDFDPQTARELYERTAREDDCRGQAIVWSKN